MEGLLVIFLFVILMAVPGFYMITRKIFPKMSKKEAGWISGGLTALLVLLLMAMTWTA